MLWLWCVPGVVLVTWFCCRLVLNCAVLVAS